MKTLLMTVCAAQLLMSSAQNESLARLVEAYSALLASPHIPIAGLEAMRDTGRLFELKGASASETVVLREALRDVEGFVEASFPEGEQWRGPLRRVLLAALEQRRAGADTASQAGSRVLGDPKRILPEERFLPTKEGVNDLFFGHDGNGLVGFVGGRRNIKRWGLNGTVLDWNQSRSISLEEGKRYTFSHAPATGRLYVKAPFSDLIYVIDTHTLYEEDGFGTPVGKDDRPVAVTPDGAVFAIQNGPDALVQIWGKAASPSGSIAIPQFKVQQFVPDRPVLASMDTKAGKLSFAELGGESYSFDYHPPFKQADDFGKKLRLRAGAPHAAVVYPETSHIAVFDWKQRKEVLRLQPAADWEGRCLGFYDGLYSPDGKVFAAVQSIDWPTVFVWDASTGVLLAQWPVDGASVTALAFSPDGRRLAGASSYYPGVHIWNLAERVGWE